MFGNTALLSYPNTHYVFVKKFVRSASCSLPDSNPLIADGVHKGVVKHMALPVRRHGLIRTENEKNPALTKN